MLDNLIYFFLSFLERMHFICEYARKQISRNMGNWQKESKMRIFLPLILWALFILGTN